MIAGGGTSKGEDQDFEYDTTNTAQRDIYISWH